jgi:hypothetical protein
MVTGAPTKEQVEALAEELAQLNESEQNVNK